MNSADFEQHLKQLRPANCDDQLAETFYQSGWQACEKSQSVRVVDHSSHRTVPTFVTGLVCGVMFSVVGFLWGAQAEGPAGVNVAEQKAEQPPESKNGDLVSPQTTTDVVVVNTSEVPSPAVPTELWKIDDLFVVSPLVVDKPSPLSKMARRGWTKQMRASAELTRHSLTTSDSSLALRTSEDEVGADAPMTASPFNRSMLEELML